MTAQTTAERTRLRELHVELGWTQQQLADKLAQLTWTNRQGHAAVNADMVAKRERDVTGISPRDRALLCQLFGLTTEQLGFAPVPSTTHRKAAGESATEAGESDGRRSMARAPENSPPRRHSSPSLESDR